MNELNISGYINLFDKLEVKYQIIKNFNSILKGFINSLDRFKQFLESFEILEEVWFNYNGGINNHSLEKEYNMGKDLHFKFLKSIKEEIHKFSNENKNINNEIITAFINFIKLSNNNVI